MYKIFCEKCGHHNYSASKAGNWICCYCGEELKSKVNEAESKKRELEKLA